MYETDTWDKAYVPNVTEIADEEFPYIVPDDASPEEVFEVMYDRKTLLVPRLQSMKNYIAFHYKRTIVKHLIKYLAVKVQDSGKQYSDAAKVNAVQLKEMNFWSFGKYTLIAQISLDADIDFGEWHGIKKSYYATMEFDMEDDIKLIRIVIDNQKTNVNENDSPNYYVLDQYLIPVMNKALIEERAETLLKTYNTAGWADQHNNTPGTMAQKMGLNIVMLPLHRCKKNKSQLFFKKGTVTVDTDEKDENNKVITKRVDVEGNTIVINLNAVRKDYCMLEIYHECVHFEWHYMFYLLQDMYTNDLRQIKKTRSVQWKGRKKADALSWLEFQAVHGSFAVWMPTPFMKKQIETRAAQAAGMHPGAMYECICMGIANEYKIPPFRVRARIVRMGQIEARGACNYLDDHFIQPFSFQHDKGSGDYTFFISREQFAKNYFQDKEFRKLIDSREFMYVDGHVCINDPGLFYQTNKGPRLKEEALKHIDRYCLRFVEVYERDETYIFRFGRLHSDEEYNKHFLYFPPREYTEEDPQPDAVHQQQINMRYLRKLPRFFPDMLVQLMKDCSVSIEELSGRTGISTRTINRLRNEPRTEYSADQIVAIIVGLHLPPWVSDQVLKATSISFSDNLATYNYSYVVSCMFMDTFEAVKGHLALMGLNNLCLEDPITA